MLAVGYTLDLEAQTHGMGRSVKLLAVRHGDESPNQLSERTLVPEVVW